MNKHRIRILISDFVPLYVTRPNTWLITGDFTKIIYSTNNSWNITINYY
mgnify:CR=1 FL=1